jgi:hypothetical protein
VKFVSGTKSLHPSPPLPVSLVNVHVWSFIFIV